MSLKQKNQALRALVYLMASTIVEAEENVQTAVELKGEECREFLKGAFPIVQRGPSMACMKALSARVRETEQAIDMGAAGMREALGEKEFAEIMELVRAEEGGIQ